MYVCMFLFSVHGWSHCGYLVLYQRQLTSLLNFDSDFLELSTIFAK